MHRFLNIQAYGLLFLALLCCCAGARAQSGSADVLPKGERYLEFDFNSHLEPHGEGGYQTYASRFVMGVGRGVEVGLNVEASDPVVEDQGVEFQPNIKWQFHNNESRGTTASVGAVLFVPGFRRAGTDKFGLVYADFSKQLRGRFGPSFTGGGYTVVGRAAGFGSRAGVKLGYAQPLHPKVSFNLDWWSGSNDRVGYVTPSFTFALSARSQLTAGYGVGNFGRKNNELALAYGFSF